MRYPATYVHVLPHGLPPRSPLLPLDARTFWHLDVKGWARGEKPRWHMPSPEGDCVFGRVTWTDLRSGIKIVEI